MPTGVQSGKFVDRAKETIIAHLQAYFTVSQLTAEQVASSIIDCLENDLKAGSCYPLSQWVWGSGPEAAAGKPGTPRLHNRPLVATPAVQPPAAVAAGVSRGVCPGCKKQYENCSCSFGFPNGK